VAFKSLTLAYEEHFCDSRAVI